MNPNAQPAPQAAGGQPQDPKDAQINMILDHCIQTLSKLKDILAQGNASQPQDIGQGPQVPPGPNPQPSDFAAMLQGQGQ